MKLWNAMAGVSVGEVGASVKLVVSYRCYDGVDGGPRLPWSYHSGTSRRNLQQVLRSRLNMLGYNMLCNKFAKVATWPRGMHNQQRQKRVEVIQFRRAASAMPQSHPTFSPMAPRYTFDIFTMPSHLLSGTRRGRQKVPI